MQNETLALKLINLLPRLQTVFDESTLGDIPQLKQDILTIAKEIDPDFEYTDPTD